MADAKGIKAGKAYVELGADGSSLEKALTWGEKKLKAFGATAMKVGASFAGVGVSVGGGLVAAAKLFSDAGSQIDDISQRVGDSATNISAIGYAAKLTGTDLETLSGGLTKMSGLIAGALDGEKASVALLKKLGLTAADLKGKLPTEQLAIFADKIAGISDVNVKTDLAKSIFGKSGVDLIPLLNEGSGGIARLRAEAESLGVVMTNDDAKAAAAFGDALDRLMTVAGSLVNHVGGALAPILTNIADQLSQWGGVVVSLIDKNQGLVIGIGAAAVAITAVGTALVGAGVVAATVATAISGLVAVVGAIFSPFGAAVIAIGAVAAGLGAGVYAFIKYTSAGQSMAAAITDAFGGLAETVSTTFGGIVAAIRNGDLGSAGEIALAGLKVAFGEGLDGIVKLWKTAMVTIKSIIDNLGAGILTAFENITHSVKIAISKLMSDPAIKAALVIAGGPSALLLDLMPKPDEKQHQKTLDSIGEGLADTQAKRAKELEAIKSQAEPEWLKEARATLTQLSEKAQFEANWNAAEWMSPETKKKAQEGAYAAQQGVKKAQDVASVGAATRDSAAAASAIAKAFNTNSYNDKMLSCAQKSEKHLEKIADKDAIEVVEYAV